jgi:hypothetical protein
MQPPYKLIIWADGAHILLAMAMVSNQEEIIMEREYQDNLVELGVVSVDTKGASVGREDTDIGQQFLGGLTDD